MTDLRESTQPPQGRPEPPAEPHWPVRPPTGQLTRPIPTVGSEATPASPATDPAPVQAAPIEDRRSRRAARQQGRGRQVLFWVLVAVATVAIAAATFFGLSALGRARAAQADFDAAIKLMEDAEADLDRVDEAVRAEITSELATRAAEVVPVAAQVKADADAAIALIDGALIDLSPGAVPLAEAVKESAQARSAMTADAPAILEADAKAAGAMVSADAAVEEIKRAEEASAKAVVEFNKHTKAGVQQSTAYSNQAETHLKAAQSLITSATAEFPEADFGPFTRYVDAKLELVADSRAIDSLWLANKIEESNAKLTAYNKKDAQIVAMAEALPDSVRDPIADAYDLLTAEATDRYFAARERARAADKRLEELRKTTGIKQ